MKLFFKAYPLYIYIYMHNPAQSARNHTSRDHAGWHFVSVDVKGGPQQDAWCRGLLLSNGHLC